MWVSGLCRWRGFRCQWEAERTEVTRVIFWREPCKVNSSLYPEHSTPESTAPFKWGRSAVWPCQHIGGSQWWPVEPESGSEGGLWEIAQRWLMYILQFADIVDSKLHSDLCEWAPSLTQPCVPACAAIGVWTRSWLRLHQMVPWLILDPGSSRRWVTLWVFVPGVHLDVSEGKKAVAPSEVWISDGYWYYL